MRVIIPWKPHAKQRPRTVKGGHTYTPKATKEAEASIVAAFRAERPDHVPMETPLAVKVLMHDDRVDIIAVPCPPPQSKKLRGDVDNYAKTILDALNGVAWVDDRQIASLEVVKA